MENNNITLFALLNRPITDGNEEKMTNQRWIATGKLELKHHHGLKGLYPKNTTIGAVQRLGVRWERVKRLIAIEILKLFPWYKPYVKEKYLTKSERTEKSY